MSNFIKKKKLYNTNNIIQKFTNIEIVTTEYTA